jgi:hypothetical protein
VDYSHARFVGISEWDEKEILASPVLCILVNKYPLMKWVPSVLISKYAIKDKRDLSFVHPCLDGTGKRGLLTSGSCKCGALVASIAKGIHEGDSCTNPHLKISFLRKFLPLLDNFREAIVSSESFRQKHLLCLFLRLFIKSPFKSIGNYKYSLIGTDQRNTTKYGSNGCQVGMVPFCYDFLRLLFGKWTGWSSLDNYAVMDQVGPDSGDFREVVFMKFIEECLESGMTDCQGAFSADGKVKLSIWMTGIGRCGIKRKRELTQTITPGNGGGYNRTRFSNILLNLCCRSMATPIHPVWMNSAPKLPSAAGLFEDFNRAQLLPVTGSMSISWDDFCDGLRCVFSLFGDVQEIPREKSRSCAKGGPVQSSSVALASHRMRYFWTEENSENIVMRLVGTGPAYVGKVIGTGEKLEVYHATNVTVHPCESRWSKILFDEVVEIAVGTIPKRTGQPFGHQKMMPYAASTHTLLRVFENGTRNDSGLLRMVDGILTGDDCIRNGKREALLTMQHELARGMKDELRCNHAQLGISASEEFHEVYSAMYCHSRFDTVVWVRPAPHLDAHLGIIEELQNEKTFVKDFWITGREGLWLRLFCDWNDVVGRLIRLEPDSILGVPITAIKEVGRISHIEGNPHYVIRIMLTAKSNSLTGRSWDTDWGRFYPHLGKTIIGMRNQGIFGDELERRLGTVGLHRHGYTCVQKGLKWKSCEALKFLSTLETQLFDENFEI